MQEEELPAFQRRVYYTRPVWIIGMVLIVLGAIGDFEALGYVINGSVLRGDKDLISFDLIWNSFAPQALVASVGGGCTVLANVFFAHLWLGQNLTITDVVGTILIIIGVVLSTVVNEPDDKMSLAELERQFWQPGFLVYLGVMVSASLWERCIPRRRDL
jgi:xanthine/uracil permease